MTLLSQAMVRMLRHKDKKLAVFQGGIEREVASLDAVLPKKDQAPMSFAPKSGYQRLDAEQTTILVDTGGEMSGAHSVKSHPAPLAFEMSHGTDRLIVNCGPNLVHGADWKLAARGLPGNVARARRAGRGGSSASHSVPSQAAEEAGAAAPNDRRVKVATLIAAAAGGAPRACVPSTARLLGPRPAPAAS